MIRILKCLFLSLSIFMVGLVIMTSMQSDMFHLSSNVLNEPWFKTTLVDFYFNITIISAWMLYKENHWLRGVWWFIAFIALGSIATAFYVVLQLVRLKPGESIEKALLRSS